jgi:PIN domain nuclease of toxin-antitoxin system
MKLLLDTCTFIWIALDTPQLSDTASRLFRDPSNQVYLSAASAWEIAVKSGQGRLSLPQSAGKFITEQRMLHEIESLPISEEAALQGERLPRIHGDPFDRILVCQAVVHGLAILTPDEAISQYAVRVLW